MKYKKMFKNVLVLSLVVLVGEDVQAKSLSYYKDKTRSGVSSTWHKTKSSFKNMQKKAYDVVNSIDPKTLDNMKKLLITAGVSIGAAAGAAAVGYAITEYDLFGLSGAQNQTEKVFTSTVNMLKNDSKYSNDIGEQFRYLLDTDMDLNQIDGVLDIINPGRGT